MSRDRHSVAWEDINPPIPEKRPKRKHQREAYESLKWRASQETVEFERHFEALRQ